MAKAKGKRVPKPEPIRFVRVPTEPVILEGIGNAKYLGRYVQDWLGNGARVGNGDVVMRKYRVTIELIEETDDVLRERLRKLWRESEPNSHSWGPMQQAAAELDMGRDELRYDDQGIDHPRHHSKRGKS